ncbi:hypothetical protein VKT23_018415 [Stygiomarasmius scandens]|uniref:Uncharacterized protein n=1 Tax=Marasmiellus scandens TaxID=2682957 RepID=A0ABR1ITG3_9AGAR
MGTGGTQPIKTTPVASLRRAPGQGSSGEHILIAANLFGGDLRRSTMSLEDPAPYPLKLAKRILFHTPANLMSTAQIASWLAADLSRRHAPEMSEDDGVVQTQPPPVISIEEAMNRCFAIDDFGNGKYL